MDVSFFFWQFYAGFNGVINDVAKQGTEIKIGNEVHVAGTYVGYYFDIVFLALFYFVTD